MEKNLNKLVNQYLQAIENPKNEGWNPELRIWEAPKKNGYDVR